MAKFIKSQQSNIKILNGVVSSTILNKVSKALKYGEDQWGYQRDQKPDHINSILSYINSNKEDSLFPNSIILAMDENDYKDLDDDNDIIDLDLSKYNLRIVDGQHRLEAIKQSKYEFKLNVVILIIPEKDRSKELDIFISINSKAKRIHTDLAELAKFKYILLNKNNSDDAKFDYVTMKIIVDLNESSKYWKDAIKININEKPNNGIVGVSAFKKTLIDIVKFKLDKIKEFDLYELDKQSSEIKDFIENVWKICYLKWESCFIHNKEGLTFSNKHYLQRTIGISVIHGLIKEIYLKNKDQELDIILNEFHTLIQNSNVKSSNWELGNVMSGYSSESGFSKIRSFIKNEIKLA